MSLLLFFWGGVSSSCRRWASSVADISDLMTLLKSNLTYITPQLGRRWWDGEGREGALQTQRVRKDEGERVVNKWCQYYPNLIAVRHLEKEVDPGNIFFKLAGACGWRCASRELRLGANITCSMSAWGEWTKMEALSLGEDSRQSWASVARGLYVKAMLEDSLPSYSKVLWCSANSKSLSALYLKVPWGRGEESGDLKSRARRNTRVWIAKQTQHEVEEGAAWIETRCTLDVEMLVGASSAMKLSALISALISSL